MRISFEDLYGGLRLASAASRQGQKRASKVADKPVPPSSISKADVAKAEAAAWARGYADATKRAALILSSRAGRRNLDKTIKLLAEPAFLRLDAAAAINLIGKSTEHDEAQRAAKAKGGWSRSVATINGWSRMGEGESA